MAVILLGVFDYPNLDDLMLFSDHKTVGSVVAEIWAVEFNQLLAGIWLLSSLDFRVVQISFEFLNLFKQTEEISHKTWRIKAILH